MTPLVPGYYWYRVHTPNYIGVWCLCQVRESFVDFFGQVSQQRDSEYLRMYVEFGGRVVCTENS